MEYVLLIIVIIWVAYQFYRGQQDDRKKIFFDNMRKFCLSLMEPTIGKQKKWVIKHFKKYKDNLESDLNSINQEQVTFSVFTRISEGTFKTEFVPMFDEDDICRDYDVWYVFYDNEGMTTPDKQFFTSRKTLIVNKKEEL